MVLMRLPVSSAALLCRAVVQLMSREWLVALIGRDVLSGRSVEAEATGLLPSRPRARWRIGTSSEALRVGPRSRRRIGSPSEALRAGPRASRGIGTSSEPYVRGLERGEESAPCPSLMCGASSEAENQHLVRGLTGGASDESGYYSRWAGRSSRVSDKVGVCQ